MTELAKLLEGYTQQKLPSLALRTGLESSRLQVDVASSSKDKEDASASNVNDEDHTDRIWAAVVRLICAYADTTDLLLVERQQNSTDKVNLIRLHVELDQDRQQVIEQIAQARKDALSSTLTDLEEAARQEGMSLQLNQSPALITIGTHASISAQPEWYPAQGIAIAWDAEERSLCLAGDAQTICEDMARMLLQQVWALAQQLAASPSDPFRRMSLPSDTLQSRYEAPYDADEAHLPIDWLRHQAETRPDAIAHELCDEPDDDKVRTLTFAELDQQSNRMAHWLLEKHGIKKGAPVGVCRKRDEWFYIAMAAILKAGGCYLPIDRDLPIERRAYIAEDSDAALILTDGEGAQDDMAGKPCIDVDQDTIQQEIDAASSEAPTVSVDLDDLAYILYTSGTSGKPKGCQLMHRGLYWAIRTFVEVPRDITTPDTDKRLAMAAVAFDVHVSEMVQTWAVGVRLVSVASRMSLMADLQGTIERFGITHIGMVPSMIEATLTKSPSELPIKYITSGGEKVSDRVLQIWANDPNIVFANMYGPTEATIGCTVRVIKGTHEPKEAIGHAFLGSAAYIVDADLQIVPKGVAGELIIEGPLVARGYINLPDATAKSFLEWPKKGCRAYRTGDLVRMNHDGSLSIHGRIDSQIKLRGVRIESEGVSNVISEASQDPRLDAVSVICKHDAVGDAEMLVTFVTQSKSQGQEGQETKAAHERQGIPQLWHPTESTLMSTLREAAQRGLASYMRPSHIVPLTFFPLSHNGKIDTKPLTALFQDTPMEQLMEVQGLGEESTGSQDEDDGAHAGPSTDSEKMIVDAICQITGSEGDSISVKRGLLESGLSSLNCARLTAMLRNKTGKRFGVADVMATTSIRACAEMVDQAQEENQGDTQDNWDAQAFYDQHIDQVKSKFDQTSIEAILPPLPVQPGVLFQAMHHRSSYVQHFTYRISSDHREGLEEAWATVQTELDILRTAFFLEEGDLIQVILKPDHVQVPFRRDTLPKGAFNDAHAFDEAVQQSGVLDKVAERLNAEITTPMFQITLFEPEGEQSKQECRMTISLSHTIYDAFAVRTIMHHLDRALSQERQSDADDQLTALTLVEYLASQAEEEHRQFWRSTLQPVLQGASAPSDQRLTKKADEPFERCNRVLSTSLDDVQRLCGRLNVTPQTFFNVVFAMSVRQTLDRWHKQALFGNVRSGRNLPLDHIDRAAFPLVTVVPCVIDFEPQRVRDILTVAHRSLVASTTHENVALSQIHTWVESRNLVDVLFSCRSEETADRSKAYKTIQHLTTSQMEPEFALAVEVLFDQMADTIDIRVAHCPSALSKDTVAKLIEEMAGRTQALLDDPDLEVAQAEGQEGGSRTNDARQTEQQSQQDTVEVDDELVQTIQGALSTFLKQDASMVQPKTSLVSMGMTSLRAVAFCHHLKREHGIELDPVNVVQGDNVLSIARTQSSRASKLQAKGTTNGDGGSHDEEWTLTQEDQEELGHVQLYKDDQIELAPCTPLQSGILTQTMASDGALYVHAFAMQLHKADQKQLQAIQQAWQEAQAKYGILRTSFHFLPTSGHWIQVQHTSQSCRLELVTKDDDDVSADEARQKAIEMLDIQSEASLQKPPIALVHFVKSNLLVLALHHAMYDGVSLANLMRYVANSMAGHEMPDTPSFLTVARQLINTEQEATDYWVKRLNGVEQHSFLPCRSSEQQITTAERYGLDLDANQSDAVRQFGRRYGVSVQSISQVALACTLQHHGEGAKGDIVLCQVVSGRTRSEAGQAVGPVFNTVGVRIALLQGVTAKEAVRQAQHDNGQSLPYHHAPLRSVQKAVGCSSLSDVLFLYQPGTAKEEQSDASSPPWELLTSTSEQGSTQFTLNLEVHDSADPEVGLKVRASGASDVFSQESLGELVQAFQKHLLEIVQSPNKVLAPELKNVKPKTNGHTNGHVNGHAKAKFDASVEQEHGELVQILSQVMQVEPQLILQGRNLKSLGLDSIAAMQVSSRLRKQGHRVSPMQILRTTSLTGLVKLIGQGGQTGQKGEDSKRQQPSQNTISLDPPQHVVSAAVKHLEAPLADHARAYLPSPGLRYLFAGWQRSGGRQFSICIGRKAAQGRLDVDALSAAWQQLTARHAVLRSTMVPSGDTKVPLVLFVVEAAHWKGLVQVEGRRSSREPTSEKEDEATAQEYGRTLMRQPPSMCAPSSRLTVVRLTHFDAFFVQMPHIHYDAFTVPRLMEELWQAYLKPSSQEKEQDDLSTWEEYLRYSLTGVEGNVETHQQKQKEYWQSVLGDHPSPHLWHEHEVDTTVPVTYLIRECRDGTPTVQALQDCAERLKVTPAALLAATWAHVHAHLPGAPKDDPSSTFALVNSGRTAEVAGLEDVFAPTINLVPLRIKEVLPAAEQDDRAALQDSIAKAAQAVQAHWDDQPAWAIQTAMSDLQEWFGQGDDAVVNTTLNVQIRPTRAAGSLRNTVRPPSKDAHNEAPWSPIRLAAGPRGFHGDRGWDEEEIRSFKVPDLLLDQKGHVRESCVRIDARLVVAASHAKEGQDSVVVLEAEVAREVLSRDHVDQALQQWAHLLCLALKQSGSVAL